MKTPTERKPTHPCEMLREEFLIPMNENHFKYEKHEIARNARKIIDY